MSELSPLGMAALTYSQEYGMPVFPLRPRDKKPLIPKSAGGDGFKDASTHPEQICAWWDEEPNANIGFSPGSMGWIVIDVDGPEAEAYARSLGMLDVSTLAVRTARGHHYYFALPKGVSIGNSSIWDKKGINVRSSAGYVALPPSVHASGHVYTWVGNLE